MARAKNSIKKECSECHRQLTLDNYYNTNNILSGDGKASICKDCLKKKIDTNNIQTVQEVLKSLDLPFLYDSWKRSIEKKPDNPFGDYIRMANSGINEFKGCTWKDSVFEPQLDYDNTELNKNIDQLNYEDSKKIYSKEWHGFYTQYEIDYLDDYLKGLKNDFKIVTTNHKDYAKKICQASLAVDKAFQDMSNCVSGADKKYKDLQETFDKLSKSAQFSESQRGINDVSLGCFGVIFDKIEQKQWITKHSPIDRDDYDKLIDYFSTIKQSI